MADVKSGDMVVPGDQLCVIAELMPGFGTYDKEGIVYAATTGSVEMDLNERSISIRSGSRLALPIKGDVMVGEVIVVYDQRAEVSLVKRNGENILSGLLGEIHISNVTRRYIKSLQDVLKPRDIVRGVALNTHEIPVALTLVGPDNGVLAANCSKCGTKLTLTTYNNLICLKCENREVREVAKDYGVMFGLETRQDLAPKRRPRPSHGYGDRRSGPRRHTDRRGRGGGNRRYSDRHGDRRRR